MSIRAELVCLAVLIAFAGHAAAQEVEDPPKKQDPEPAPVLPGGGGGESMAMSSSGSVWDTTAAPMSFSTIGHTGGFTTSIPIRVPSFRGLEPGVALSYNSGGGNGFAGVGWSVSGFSRIERKSADGGWPNWDATDTFWFGGQKLIACGASASPGCTSGGTHFAENENYLRIADNGDDTWTVTNRSGTQSHYTAMGASGADKRRFGISSRVDTLGNTVTYTWSCTTETDYCYPETIEYNGAVVTFYRETRPDPISAGDEIEQTDRLVTIDVTVSGARARAYALSYATSPASERSLLESVQMYGTDAVLDGNDRVVPGSTSAPATSFAYREDPTPDTLTDPGSSLFNQCPGADAVFGTGDFNADGVSDIYCKEQLSNGSDVWIALSHGDGTFPAPYVAVTYFCGHTAGVLVTGDFDGDQDIDFACQRTAPPWRNKVVLNNGDGTFASQVEWAPSWCPVNQGALFGTVDANGDGKTDV